MSGYLVEKRVGGTLLTGYSMAGEETVIALPELNVCFDPGRAPAAIIPIDNVCISHGHMDHAAGVAYYLSQRRFVGNAPGRVIVHRRLAQHIQRLMAVWADLERHHTAGVIEGVSAGDEVSVRRGLVLRAFDVNHSDGALGFGLIENRHKLKPEFADYTGPQLVELKKKGISIEDHVEVPLVTYCGDTALGPFLDLDFVRKAHVLLLECTFFAPDHLSRAREGRHIHVCDLPQALERLDNPNIVLIHITRRTGLGEAKAILRRTLSERDRDRVSIFMERPRRPGKPIERDADSAVAQSG